MDKFSIYCHRVKKALEKYNKVRDLSNMPYKGMKETIERESNPFIKGYFTIAVIGKTNSGKSTFINALLGDQSLLPTDYEQTTCTLTEIVYGDNLRIHVSYGDGHASILERKTELLGLVSIPPEYKQLPVNTINSYILEGKSETDIFKNKSHLEKEQSAPIDEKLLKKYIKAHSPKNIPVKVEIEYPLSEQYKGWKIVDTPGVGALGGIEKTTYNFLNDKNEYGYNNVDAIVFVNSTRNAIQDKAFKEFVDNTVDNIPREFRKRIFIVFTCSTDNSFMQIKENYMETAKHIFTSGLDIPLSKLIYIDSICHLFVLHAKKCGEPILALKKKMVPNDWNAKTWELGIDIRNYFRDELGEAGCEVNNESLIKELESRSGFKSIQTQFNEFIEKEKETAFQQLMQNINKDITSILNEIRQKKYMLEKSVREKSNNLSLMELREEEKKEKEKLENVQNAFNDILKNIRDKFSIAELDKSFQPIKKKIFQLRLCPSMDVIRRNSENCSFELEETVTEILENLKTTMDKLWDNTCTLSSIVFPSIDYDSIIEEAKRNNTHEEFKGYEEDTVEQKGFIAALKRFFHIGGYEKVPNKEKPNYESIYNEENATRDFANGIYNQWSFGLYGLINKLNVFIQEVGDEAKKKIEKIVQQKKDSLTQLVESNQTIEKQEESIKEFDKQIGYIQNTLVEITNLSND